MTISSKQVQLPQNIISSQGFSAEMTLQLNNSPESIFVAAKRFIVTKEEKSSNYKSKDQLVGVGLELKSQLLRMSSFGGDGWRWLMGRKGLGGGVVKVVKQRKVGR